MHNKLNCCPLCVNAIMGVSVACVRLHMQSLCADCQHGCPHCWERGRHCYLLRCKAGFKARHGSTHNEEQYKY